MTQSLSLEKLLEKLQLGEGVDFEVKLAAHDLPASIWETYSAFANTLGGYLVLGVKQSKDVFFIEGVQNPPYLVKQLWDLLNNLNKVSSNLLNNSDIEIRDVSNKQVIVIRIPAASRKERPVFINGNPYTGAFKRYHEGDYRCDEDEIKRMIRDASDAPFDTKVIGEYGLGDLDLASIEQFKNRFASRSPGHPFLSKNQKEFLNAIGAWDFSSETQHEGPTLAGLLMFGKEKSITKILPSYNLDYQEQLGDDPNQRWSDRITLDGTYEGNLFQFTLRVHQRLVSHLGVPFQTREGTTRIDETQIHEAVREALVNTIIHADYQGPYGIKVVKKKDHFLFRNSGRLRLPIHKLYEGGYSDCRNPNLQKMYFFLGWGERAGSGFQKILQAWKNQHWMRPFVREDLEMGVTFVYLPLISVIPEKISQELLSLFGEHFKTISPLERSILILTYMSEETSNATLQQFRGEHPTDITKTLGHLVDEGFLEANGKGRGTVYKLARHKLEASSIEHSASSIEHSASSIEHSASSIEHLDKTSDKYKELWSLSQEIRERAKAPKSLIQLKIKLICKDQFVSLKLLSELLNRNFDTLRNHYINPLIKEGKLVPRYPEQPRHPGQAYKTKR